MSIDVNVTNDLVVVTESSEDITVNVSNAPGPAGQGVPVGGTAGQVLKKLSNTNYDTFWTLDGVGVPYTGATGDVNLGAFNLTATSIIKSGGTSSQFLKADGSVDSTTYQPLLTNPVTGTGATGQVAYWNGTNSQTGSNNLFWDAANSRLGVFNSSPLYNLEVGSVSKTTNSIVNTATDNPRRAGFSVDNGSENRFFAGYVGSTTFNEANSEVYIGSPAGYKLAFGTSNTIKAKIFNTGNLVLQNGGTFSDAGQRLQVQGDAFIKGSGATSGTIGLQVQDSGGANMLRLLNDTTLKIGSQNVDIFPTANGSSVSNAGRGLIISTGAGSQGTGALKVVGTSLDASGNNWSLWLSHTFGASSGTATHSGLLLNQTINQTGGANGITRGLYVNPTLTSAFDFRAIETTAGNVLFGSNFFWNNTNNRLGINTSTPASALQVVGTVNATNVQTPLVFSTGADPLTFATQGGTSAMVIQPVTRNVIIQNAGAISDGGQRLQVGGDVFIKGSGATFSTSALQVVNSAGNLCFSVLNNQEVNIASGAYFGSGNIIRVGASSSAAANFRFTTSSNYLGFYGDQISTALFLVSPSAANNTTGTNLTLWGFTHTFNPTSGTASYVNVGIATTINQTGGANGITRGLYVAPVLTAAADWRSIEWSNNSGWGLYGAGTAANLLNGNLGIGGSDTVFNQKLYINGNIRIQDGGGVGNTNSTTSEWVKFNSVIGLLFGTNGSERARITTAGRLLLGTSTESTYILDVNGTARVSGASTFARITATTSGIELDYNSGILYHAGGSGSYYQYIDGVSYTFRSRTATGSLIFATQDIERMRLTAGGNLLVGTTADQGYRVQITGSGDNMLNVWGATAPSIRLDNAASGATQRFVLGLATATNNFIQGASAGDVCITTATASPIVFGMWQTSTASEVMRITTSNNLLVGTTVDNGQKLQVSGAILATSFVKSGGTSSQYLMADGSVTTGGGGGSVDELQVALISQVFG